MGVLLTYTSNDPVIFSSGTPDGFTGRILVGSDMFSTTDHAVSLVVQELAAEQYTVRYNLFKFFKKITLKGFCLNPGLYIRVMLKGQLTHRIKDLGRIHLKSRRFAILMVESGECLTQFERGKEYETFDLYFSKQLLEPLTSIFPQLIEYLNQNKRSVMPLSAPTTLTDQRIMSLIDLLLSAPYNKTTGQIFVDEKIHELLNLLLAKLFVPRPSGLRVSTKELESLSKAKEFIEENYHLHFTIRQIAKQVGLNELKLKNGFRQTFSMGIFDCLIHARMKKGLELVIHSEQSIKEISYQAGYKRLTSFVTAFKKYYGKSPGKMRYNK